MDKKNAFGLPSKTNTIVSKPTKTQIIEARKMLLAAQADPIISKAIMIALDNEHPGQMSAMKMCMDRILPMSEFEQKKDGSRTAITITIGGLSDVVVEGKPEDVEEI